MTVTILPAETASQRADALEEAGDLNGAIQALTEAIELAPDKPIYRALRGRLYSLQKQWRAAIRDFDRVLAVKPNAPSALYTRGRARFMIDEYDGAIADLEHCIAVEPEAADAWAVLGDVHRYREDWEPAIRAYQRARELEPDKRDDLEELIVEMQEQLWLREHGQLQPEPPATRRYSPPPSQEPEAVQRRDELQELFQRRREAAVPYQRVRGEREDPEG